jgi:hypothetical protein
MNTITQSDIDRINELHRGIKRASVRVLKDALQIGEFFVEAHDEKGIKRGGWKKNKEETWANWLEENFPDIATTSVYQYMRVARNRETIESISAAVDSLAIKEADRLVRWHERREKIKQEQPPSLNPDAHPLEELKAKLSRYVVGLWQLRYLETEILGMMSALELSNEEIQRALNHVCQSHMEVKDEVMKVFSPYPRLLKSAK